MLQWAAKPNCEDARQSSAERRFGPLGVVVDALALVGLPALAIGREGRVLAANELVEGAAEFIRWLPGPRIGFPDPSADDLLQRCLAMRPRVGALGARSFAIRSGDHGTGAVAHLLPVPDQVRDPLREAAVLVVAPVATPRAPDPALICHLFALTASEARVAHAVTQGMSIDEIAARCGVDRETVRSQLKAVFAKTGTNRQAQLASLLAGLPALPIAKE